MQNIVNQNGHVGGYNLMMRVATQMSANLRNRFRENLTMFILIILISLLTVLGNLT
jgi:hypothetical protein